MRKAYLHMYNDKNKKSLRQILRNEMPKGEKCLWQKLRRKQAGFKFLRQYGVGDYVADFYCPQIRLAIEVDGLTHEDPVRYRKDTEKQKYLEFCNIKVLYFVSSDVFKKLDSIMDTIYYECEKRKAGMLQ